MRIKDYLIEHVIMDGSIKNDGFLPNILEFRLKGLAQSAKELPAALYTPELDQLFFEFKDKAGAALYEMCRKDLNCSMEFKKEKFTYDNVMRCADMFSCIFPEVCQAVGELYSYTKIHNAEQRWYLLGSCRRFREALAELESEVKKQLILTYRLPKPEDITQLLWEPADWVVARSVWTLGIEAGERGVDYPIVSAGLLDLRDPQWYEQERRHTLLMYDICDTDRVLGMYTGDGNTTADYVADLRNKFQFSVGRTVSQLLIDDGLDDAVFNYYTCGFAPAHAFDIMRGEYNRYRANGDTSSVRTEIVLRSDAMPTGIIVTSPGDHGEEWRKTIIFSRYYKIPVLLLFRGQLRKIDLD